MSENTVAVILSLVFLVWLLLRFEEEVEKICVFRPGSCAKARDQIGVKEKNEDVGMGNRCFSSGRNLFPLK